jgi:hypothetical protein
MNIKISKFVGRDMVSFSAQVLTFRRNLATSTIRTDVLVISTMIMETAGQSSKYVSVFRKDLLLPSSGHK